MPGECHQQRIKTTGAFEDTVYAAKVLTSNLEKCNAQSLAFVRFGYNVAIELLIQLVVLASY